MLKHVSKCLVAAVMVVTPVMFVGCDKAVTTEKTKEVTTTSPNNDGTVIKKEETTTTTKTP